MPTRDLLTMSRKELDRAEWMQRVHEQRMTQADVAERLGLRRWRLGRARVRARRRKHATGGQAVPRTGHGWSNCRRTCVAPAMGNVQWAACLERL
jgi:hypothetical protein